MTQTAAEGNYSNDNHRSISPLQELGFLDAMMADHELPMTARVVGYLLVRWTNGDKSHRFNGYAWARRDTLADRIGRDSEATITTATNALKARGWIIVKRRPNSSSLIRPNWDRMAQQQEVIPEDQKTVLPEEQFSVHPEDQKVGPYSADHDSADRDREVTPERSASGVSARSQGNSACGASRHGENGPVRYKQTRAEADQALEEIKQVWPEPSEDAVHRPGQDSDEVAVIEWHRLLKAGIAASRIKRAALHFLSQKPDREWSRSLTVFLKGHLHDYLDPDQPDLYIPDDEEPAGANDNSKRPVCRAVG